MGKVINISKLLDNTKPKIVWDEKEYVVNDTLGTMLKLQETLSGMEDIKMIESTLEVALGKAAVKEINIVKWSMGNFKILLGGIFAAIEGTEDVEAVLARFQRQESVT